MREAPTLTFNNRGSGERSRTTDGTQFRQYMLRHRKVEGQLDGTIVRKEADVCKPLMVPK